MKRNQNLLYIFYAVFAAYAFFVLVEIYMMINTYVFKRKNTGILYDILAFETKTALFFKYFGIFDLLTYIVVAILLYLTLTSTQSTSMKVVYSALSISLLFIFIAPIVHLYNIFLSMFLDNKPILTPKELDEKFPYHHVLESPENFARIKKEFDTYIKNETPKCLSNYHIGSLDMNTEDEKKCWKWIPLIDHNGISPESKEFPFLMSILRDNKSILSANISMLEPETEIPPHHGYLKGIYRYHLGISIPTDKAPYIVCGGQRYEWKEGEGVLFDDNYRHYVKNPSKHRRTILWLDVIRDDIPYPLNRINESVLRAIIDSKIIKSHEANDHIPKKLADVK